MKKYLFYAMALFMALSVGCSRRNSTKTADTPKTETHTHDHSNHHHTHDDCGHDHSADGHEGHNHESHESGECGPDHGDQDGTAGLHSHGEEGCDGHEHGGTHEGHAHDAHDHAADSHAGHDHSHGHGDEAADPDEIVFPSEQAKRTEFEVQVARRGTFREIIKCGGQVSVAQKGVSVVTAPVSGVVTPVDGRIMASSPVQKGQKLFYISSGSLASGDAALKAKIAYEQAKADFERAERLYRDKIISQTDYLSAQSSYLNAQSEYEPVRNINDDGSVTVNSPAGGYLSRVSVSAGDYIEMGQPLATVAGTGRMQLRALVSQRYYGRLHGIKDANFRAPSSDNYITVSALNGSLYSAGRIVSQGSSLIPVVFEFDNEGNVPDGAYVEVALLGDRRENVLSLPVGAITEQQGLYYVYVQLDSECYSRREVKIGADDGKRVEILSGVKPGDRVVTKGAINVKMAAASGSIPHGHTH